MRRARPALLLGIGLGVAAVAIASWIEQRRLSTPYQGYSGSDLFVEIPAGIGPVSIGRELVRTGVVADLLTYRVALWRSHAATRLKAGEYRFDHPMTPAEVIVKLVAGDVYLRTVTFPEGLTIRQMAQLYESRGFGTSGDFIGAASDPSLVEPLDRGARDLEGYLFPETYAIGRRTTAGELVTLMVRRFGSVYDEGLSRVARDRGLSLRQAVTLASMIEKETAVASERALVSAVYHNRLARRMGLQCDPTVIYALDRAGRYSGNLTRENLKFDSPYNTYRYAGLPPGPIAAPGRASLEAAVRPAAVDYLYFVSRNDGSHVFSSTLAEHARNVRKYQPAVASSPRGGRSAGGAARNPTRPRR